MQSQQPVDGLKRAACYECRRKKTKCIGNGEPPCRNCLESGSLCYYVESKKRGPAKGYFDSITKRLSRLEGMLENFFGSDSQQRPLSTHGSHTASSKEQPPSPTSLTSSKSHSRPSKRARRLDERTDLQLSTSLQCRNQFAVETDTESSPYSYAFKIHNFVRYAASHDFDPFGQGIWVRKRDEAEPPENPSLMGIIPSALADFLHAYYLDEIQPTAPLLDGSVVRRQLDNAGAFPSVPNALIAAMCYAASVCLKDTPNALSQDQMNAIEMNVIKLLGDISARPEPRPCAIQARIIYLLFSPVNSSLETALSILEIVKASQFLLLHKNIVGIRPRDALLRSRIWWTLYVLETWSAIRDGRPRVVEDLYIDLPLPQDIAKKDQNTPFFNALVVLSKILGQFHDQTLSYNNQNDLTDIHMQTNQALDEWYQSLPPQLRRWTPNCDISSASILMTGLQIGVLLLCREAPQPHLEILKQSYEIILTNLRTVGPHQGISLLVTEVAAALALVGFYNSQQLDAVHELIPYIHSKEFYTLTQMLLS